MNASLTMIYVRPCTEYMYLYCTLQYPYSVCTVHYKYTSKRPPRELELLGNQGKKVALVKRIFVAFLNESFILYQLYGVENLENSTRDLAYDFNFFQLSITNFNMNFKTQTFFI